MDTDAPRFSANMHVYTFSLFIILHVKKPMQEKINTSRVYLYVDAFVDRVLSS